MKAIILLIGTIIGVVFVVFLRGSTAHAIWSLLAAPRVEFIVPIHVWFALSLIFNYAMLRSTHTPLRSKPTSISEAGWSVAQRLFDVTLGCLTAVFVAWLVSLVV